MDDYMLTLLSLCDSIGEACVHRMNTGHVMDSPLEQLEDAFNEVKKQMDIEDNEQEEEVENNILYLVKPIGEDSS